MHAIRIILFLLCAVSIECRACPSFMLRVYEGESFLLAERGIPVPVLSDSADDAGVRRAIQTLLTDFESVTGRSPVHMENTVPQHINLLIIGTYGQSSYINRLAAEGKLDSGKLHGKNEAYLIQTIRDPFPGVTEALVVAGSDKRGTIYGIYELSAQMGVSPWYYWADVPVERAENLYVRRGTYTDDEPAVKYRGIFLNDEAPALSGWAEETFGGFNHLFYEKVFELLLRLKGNFIWPAMWGSAFYDDDPLNGPLADEMGIVVGTSHHEPMGRAHAEWKRYGTGEWDFAANAASLKQFWTGGMERMKEWEKVVTIGMRGDGDEAMSKETNIALLERIVAEQRKIIAKTSGGKASETPQLWALYKEVQEYYDNGMRVPDDVTLLLCDDNWGNVRKLPELTAKPRRGGYGMYYHFDYVGAPRNSKWQNVTQIQRVWEQMNLAYLHGVKQLWVVNVGDLKPMEYPIQFFLDMAWKPECFNESNLLLHTEEFCARQFGKTYAKEAARLIDAYTKYNHRITPELLNEHTYSLHHYDEFKRVTDDYDTLLLDAMKLYYLIPEQMKDAYDQLVLFPISAMANLYALYYAVAMNRDLAAKGDAMANSWADRAEALFVRDSLLTVHYHTDIAGGKWNKMMSQTHIGYTHWQQPEHNVMPDVVRVQATENKKRSYLFQEADGYVSMEAAHYARASESDKVKWIEIPNLGKTLSGMTTSPATLLPDESVHLEYDIEFATTGEVEVQLWLSPTLNYNANKGLRYAVAFDGEKEQIVNFNGHYRGELGKWQAERIIKSSTTHHIEKGGAHTLRVSLLDPGIVLQKILIDTGGLKNSFLGAPESKFVR